MSNSDNVWVTQSEGRDRTVARRVWVWVWVSFQTRGWARGSLQGDTLLGKDDSWRAFLSWVQRAFWGHRLQSWFLLSCNCFLSLPNPEIRNLSMIYTPSDVGCGVYKYHVKQERKGCLSYISVNKHTYTHTHRIKIKVCLCVPEGNQLHSIVFFTPE